VRVLAIDLGRRRIGLAISDATRTLARPLTTVTMPVEAGRDDAPAVRRVVDLILKEIARLDGVAAEDDAVGTIVVGLPTHLDGSTSVETTRTARIVEALKGRTSIPIVVEDERLTSREAESRLAVIEKDWRKRKARLDAAAAAVILQDYLDRVDRAE
jgi:putative Holliday junction resolvase